MYDVLWFSPHTYYDVVRHDRVTRSRCLFGQLLTDPDVGCLVWVTRVHPRHCFKPLPTEPGFQRRVIDEFLFGRVFELERMESNCVSRRYLVESHLPSGLEGLLLPLLRIVFKRIGFEPSHVLVNDPLQAWCLDRFPQARRLVDLTDDWRLAPQCGNQRRRIARAYEVFSQADCLSANTLGALRAVWTNQGRVLPNAWSYSEPDGPEQTAAYPEKGIGIFGNNDDQRIDWPLVEALMKRFPDTPWHLAGRATEPPFTVLSSSQVFCYGEVTSRNLDDLHKRVSVLLVPCRPMPLIQTQDSLKIYRALSQGLAVVCPGILPASRVPHLVYLYRDLAQAEQMVHTALLNEDPLQINKRRRWASDQTWTKRYEQWKQYALESRS